MQKPKEYDWKDSNMALVGSDEDRQVKKQSAETEPAWKHVLTAGPSLHIWRINKFQVEHWPREDYGKFYSGDSYIILNIYKLSDSDALLYDVHFWIGKYSTQDEYGTAAYKTVELDTLLDDRPVQHREVMDNESKLFKSYFASIITMKGGADTGFKKVKTVEYKPRLLHIMGDSKTLLMKEIPMKTGNINDEDVFIIDSGSKIYQLNGPKSNKDERYKSGQEVAKIRSERNGIPSEIIDAFDELPEDIQSKFHQGQSKQKAPPQESEVQLAKLSDASGTIAMETIATGNVTRDMLNNDDVFFLYNGLVGLVLIGDNASYAERKNAMSYGHKFIMGMPNPLVPLTCLQIRDMHRNEDVAKIFRL